MKTLVSPKTAFASLTLGLILVGGIYLLSRKTSSTPTVILNDPQQQFVVEKSRQTLSGKLGVDTKQIRFVTIEGVDWQNGALGAPEEGNVYIQIIIPGYKITFDVKGQVYESHTDKAGDQIVLVKDSKRLE